MRSYGQYCPIARAAEVLAERWTPLIVRNLLLGCTTFTEISDAAPGLSRTLLTTRLRQLERVGVVERTPKPTGRGSRYHLTLAGKDLADVIEAMGRWGERWMEVAPEHLDPGVVLHSWVAFYLERDRLPGRRVVVQFDFPDLPRKGGRLWVIFDGDNSEVCQTHPDFDVDLYVTCEARTLVEWHLGRIEWVDAIRDERIDVHGLTPLATALPSWNRRSAAAQVHRTSPTRA